MWIFEGVVQIYIWFVVLHLFWLEGKCENPFLLLFMTVIPMFPMLFYAKGFIGLILRRFEAAKKAQTYQDLIHFQGVSFFAASFLAETSLGSIVSEDCKRSAVVHLNRFDWRAKPLQDAAISGVSKETIYQVGIILKFVVGGFKGPLYKAWRVISNDLSNRKLPAKIDKRWCFKLFCQRIFHTFLHTLNQQLAINGWLCLGSGRVHGFSCRFRVRGRLQDCFPCWETCFFFNRFDIHGKLLKQLYVLVRWISSLTAQLAEWFNSNPQHSPFRHAFTIPCDFVPWFCDTLTGLPTNWLLDPWKTKIQCHHRQQNNAKKRHCD